jgi:pimeloyl-ACP methyl ester carboxylesterase
MNRRCLIPVLLVIFLFGCTSPPPEETLQDPNVTPEGIRITPDVVYGHKYGMALTFDMFQPENQNGAGVILINSNTWLSINPNFYKQTTEGFRLMTDEELASKETGWRRNLIKPLIDKSITVFEVRHESSPGAKMSEIVADLRRAVSFIRFHSGDYGVDPERFGLWDASAAGHLALLLATTADIPNQNATEEFETSTGRVATVVAEAPPTDLQRLVEPYLMNTDMLKQIPVLTMNEDQYREYSPLYFASSDDPPTLIIHGDQDKLVPIIEGESMFQALQKAGVESKFVIIPGAGHGFEGEDADHASTEAISWLEEHLAKK